MHIKIEKRGGARKRKGMPWNVPLVLKKKREEGYADIFGYYLDKTIEENRRRRGLGIKNVTLLVGLKKRK